MQPHWYHTIFSDRSSLSPKVSLSESSIFAQSPRYFACDQIFIARAFTSIPKLAFRRFQYPATLRHNVAKCRTQAVMAYLSHSSTVFCVLQEKYEIVKVHLLQTAKNRKGYFLPLTPS